MSNWHKHKEYAESITPEDDTYRGNCPFCGGRGTWTSTNDGGTLKYNCYKLGCDVGGVFDVDMSADQVKKRLYPELNVVQLREPETMEIPAYLVHPTREHEKFQRFVLRWGVFGYRGLMYDVRQERVVFPILYKGRIIDAVGRAVGVRKQPKWFRYTGQADYFTCGSGPVLLMVEDVISAIVATQYLPHVTAMAILGTSINAKHLSKAGEYSKIVIALDPDAIQKTIEYRREVQAWTGLPTYAMKLSDDIKYRRPDDIKKLEETCTND